MRQDKIAAALLEITLPVGIEIRSWNEADFPAIQRISSVEGWTSPILRSADALLAWQQSWPALVAVQGEMVVGFVRGLTDGAITTYIADLAVDEQLRGNGIGRALLDVCHVLYPTTRIDLLAEENAHAFYQACGFRTLSDGIRKSYVK